MLDLKEITAIGVAVTFFAFLGHALYGLAASYLSHWREYDHRYKLEKEYDLYRTLWTMLTRLRIALHDISEPLLRGGPTTTFEQYRTAFNRYQRHVRHTEPFIRSEVFAPADAVLRIARNIVDNLKSIEDIHKMRTGPVGDEHDRRMADKQFGLNNENEALLVEFEARYCSARAAIKDRVGIDGIGAFSAAVQSVPVVIRRTAAIAVISGILVWIVLALSRQ